VDAPYYNGDEDHGKRLHYGRPEPTEVCCDQCERWTPKASALDYARIWWFCGPECKRIFLGKDH
jgi:hypothetical protein